MAWKYASSLAMASIASLAFATLPVPPSALGGCESILELPELVPAEYWAELEAAAAGKVPADGRHRQTLTLIEVEIDPLGADPNTPWRIFQTVNVRSEPSTRGGNSTVVGSLLLNSLFSGTYYIVQQTDEEWMEIPFNGQTAYVTRTRATRPHPFNVQNIATHGNLPIGTELVNRWWGIPIDYEADDLVNIPWQFTTQIPGRVYQLRRDALLAFVKMRTAALQEGINLYALSPYRSGESQVTIYLNNVNANLAQRSSAPPGHSEHQLGTTLDLASSVGGSFISKNGAAHLWLQAHGAEFGWRQTYKADNVDETGYIEEPWHWRFFGVPEQVGETWSIH
jgi:LAS superfamily LD-carboxypeptidase LdcB